MCAGLTRRLFVFALSMALVVGLTPHAAQPAHAGLAAAHVAGHMPMSGKCGGCPDSKESSACAGYCANMVALPEASSALAAMPSEALAPLDGPSATARAIPPDPYPPRPAVLG
jgi:hypothetical protein